MKRLSVLIAVALVSLLAAVAVAGLPSDVPDDVVIAERPSTTTTTTPPRRTSPAPGTTEPPVTTEPTSEETVETDGVTNTSRQQPAQTTPSSEPPPDTADALVNPDALRVVVVNATNQPGLGGDNAAILNAFGYVNTLPTDAIDKDQPDSAIYHAPGFRREAEAMAPFVQLDPAGVTELPEDPITVQDASGDVWFVVGADRVP